MPEQPRESARGCEPSRLPIEAGNLRVGKVTCPKGRQVALRPTKRNQRFRLVAPGADFFGAGACPPEKKSLPCRFRARKSAGFQRNLRKGGAEGNPSPPPPGELERAAALSTFNQKDFRRKSYPFPRGGSGGGARSPVHLTRTACTSSSDSARAGTHHQPLPRPARSRRRSCPRFRPSRARACRGSWRRACRRECRW